MKFKFILFFIKIFFANRILETQNVKLYNSNTFELVKTIDKNKCSIRFSYYGNSVSNKILEDIKPCNLCTKATPIDNNNNQTIIICGSSILVYNTSTSNNINLISETNIGDYASYGEYIEMNIIVTNKLFILRYKNTHLIFRLNNVTQKYFMLNKYTVINKNINYGKYINSEIIINDKAFLLKYEKQHLFYDILPNNIYTVKEINLNNENDLYGEYSETKIIVNDKLIILIYKNKHLLYYKGDINYNLKEINIITEKNHYGKYVEYIDIKGDKSLMLLKYENVHLYYYKNSNINDNYTLSNFNIKDNTNPFGNYIKSENILSDKSLILFEYEQKTIIYVKNDNNYKLLSNYSKYKNYKNVKNTKINDQIYVLNFGSNYFVYIVSNHTKNGKENLRTCFIQLIKISEEKSDFNLLLSKTGDNSTYLNTIKIDNYSYKYINNDDNIDLNNDTCQFSYQRT